MSEPEEPQEFTEPADAEYKRGEADAEDYPGEEYPGDEAATDDNRAGGHP